jgi:hypothetical protein
MSVASGPIANSDPISTNNEIDWGRNNGVGGTAAP